MSLEFEKRLLSGYPSLDSFLGAIFSILIPSLSLAELLNGDEVINKEKYLEYLLKAGESLLAPFGYSEQKLRWIISYN